MNTQDCSGNLSVPDPLVSHSVLHYSENIAMVFIAFLELEDTIWLLEEGPLVHSSHPVSLALK